MPVTKGHMSLNSVVCYTALFTSTIGHTSTALAVALLFEYRGQLVGRLVENKQFQFGCFENAVDSIEVFGKNIEAAF